MEYPGGGGAVLSSGNVPAFLTKLWTLVEDPDTDPLICWSPSGTSFHVFDQGRFSKEVLPKFFKHNNMASFIRQLNMYGFRKVVHIEQGGLVKPERDDTEFQHPFFIRGQEHLLENIKRKVTNVSSVRQDDAKISAEEVNKILNDVQLMKGKQETIDSRIVTMKHENEALWREVASLRQKHTQQQKVVNKLIQFLVSLIQSNRLLGVKRKIPLMLNDSGNTHSMPKYSRPFSLEQAAANLFSADTSVTSGPIISDITDMATSGSDELASDWTDQGESQSVDIKEEPSSPEVEVCPVLEEVAAPVDTPFSPTTFINSILEENEPPTPVTSTSTASPIVVMSPVSTGPLSSASSTQSLTSVTTANTAPSTTAPQKKCQAIACIDRPRPIPSAGGLPPDVWRFLSAQPDKSELLDHVDTIDSGLENLQNILNTQTFSLDTVPFIEFFSSSGSPADFDLDSLDNLLLHPPVCCHVMTLCCSLIGAGKQLVQYTPVQTSESDSGADLPALLELETEPFLSSDPHTEDPGITLLNHGNLDSNL
uniref:HSF-type DNA-binding domain-containing protein n=1 Tax=Astatotilapia calliptera TaxID=8154 RepID=A0A3P8NVZ1_ASTCA